MTSREYLEDFSQIKSTEDQRDITAAAMMMIQPSSSSSSSSSRLVVPSMKADAHVSPISMPTQQPSSSSSSSSSNINFAILRTTEDTIDHSLLRQGSINGQVSPLPKKVTEVTPSILSIISPRKRSSSHPKNHLSSKGVPVIDSLARVVPDLQIALANAKQPDNGPMEVNSDDIHNTSDVSHHTDSSSGSNDTIASRDITREEMETLKLFVRDQLGDSAYYTGMSFLKTMVCNVDMEDDEKLILEMEEIGQFLNIPLFPLSHSTPPPLPIPL